MTRSYRKFTDVLDTFLKDPQFAADFLTDALAEEDLNLFLVSLKDILRVHGSLTSFAKKAKISRSTIYNLFSKKSNPEMKTILTVLDHLGYDLRVAKKEPSRNKSKTTARRRKNKSKI